jgi:molybdenum cofactor cytidylyltransferase
MIKKNKKNIFIYNKEYKKGMASSIKVGLKKVTKKDKGFIIVQSDMPFIKSSDINKICSSIKSKKYLVYALRFRNKVGNPIGFDISVMKKFKRLKGDVGAKFMVKRLKNETKFIKINNLKSFKDFDKVSDFRT